MSQLLRQVLGYFVVFFGIIVLFGLILAFPGLKTPPLINGVSFSAPHATGIGLDWRETYLAMLQDLGVRRFRLMAFWNQIEPAPEQHDFTDLDWQMDQAANHQARVILSVGRKLPRWPECHVPSWAKNLTELQQQEKVLKMLAVVVARYNNHPALDMWQLENEPLFLFGVCPSFDPDFLSREQSVVMSLSAKPILITDSGELSTWIPAANYGDILGTTMYRTVFSGRTQRLFSYDYLFPAWGYRLKARIVKLIRGKDVIISELQGEPWGAKPFQEMTKKERVASLSPSRLNQLRSFATRTQLPEAYWWGAEYWYWEKTVNNEPAYWEMARKFF